MVTQDYLQDILIKREPTSAEILLKCKIESNLQHLTSNIISIILSSSFHRQNLPETSSFHQLLIGSIQTMSELNNLDICLQCVIEIIGDDMFSLPFWNYYAQQNPFSVPNASIQTSFMLNVSLSIIEDR